jgi:hypothetical protein
MLKWTERLQAEAKAERDAFHDELKALEKEGNDARPPRHLDQAAVLEQDLHCESVEGTPMPYVLNVGGGFRPWSCGRRTRQGIPLVVVGADPLSFGVQDAMKAMIPIFPIARRAMAFTMPIAGEELSAAIAPGSFNAAWSDGMLLDCIDPFRVLQQMVRAVKQGGVACAKLGKPRDGALWSVSAHDGGKIVFSSELGHQTITEVRGERVEVHQMIDDSLMIKIRRREHTQADVDKLLKRSSGLVLAGGS